MPKSPVQASTSSGDYLSPESTRALINRLARIEGHVRGIARMVEERAWADEILLQVSAVKGALNRFASTLVTEEMTACMLSDKEPIDQEERIERLTKVLATILKQS